MEDGLNSKRSMPRKVKAVRETLGATQRQLALAAGTGLRFIIDLEHGKPTCETGKTLDVLNALGVRMTLEAPADAPQSDSDRVGSADLQTLRQGTGLNPSLVLRRALELVHLILDTVGDAQPDAVSRQTASIRAATRERFARRLGDCAGC